LSSLDAAKTSNSGKYHIAPFQSSQQLSQFVYCRLTDIGLKDALYGNTGVSINNNTLRPQALGAQTQFIWDYSYSSSGNNVWTPNGNGPDSNFSVHILHPDINTGNNLLLPALNEPSGAGTTSPAVYPKIIHSSFFNLQSFDVNGKLQTQYIPTNVTGASAADRYPIKLGFYSNDRYLLGSETCGSYLYLAPASYSDILVNGTDYRSTRDVEFGEKNQIVIPIVYQFRMTDFFGSGVNGTGRIGGFNAQPKNLFYTKKIGIDVIVKDESLFSFDVQISSKYKVDSPSQTSISPAQNIKFAPTQAESLNKIF
jgi:hypothetical protein